MLVCMSLAILGFVEASLPAEPWRIPVRWLSTGVLLVSAWFSSPRMALVTFLFAVGTWSWIDVATSRSTGWIPGHVARLFIVSGLMAWSVRLRKELDTARRLARLDMLTGLPNRQALIEALEAELSRSKRFGRAFSLAVMDCDGFKQINDSRGHLVGDEVLRRIGQSLRQQTRRFDCAARWGGDEFLIVLSEADKNDAQVIAERLRAAMRHDVERDHPSLTFSLGVITIQNPDLDWQECVRRADEAMYAAKREGRDLTHFDVVEPPA